jgi:hypothetical protein
MTTPDASVTSTPLSDRRSFLNEVLGAGVAVASTTLLAGCASVAGGAPATGAPVVGGTATPPTTAATEWDMSWTRKLGRYKTAYDAPEIQEGAVLSYAASALSGYKQALHTAEREFTPVLVLRHLAAVMALDDAMWERLGLGESRKLKDPTTGEPAKRNPFLTYASGDAHSYTGAEATITKLLEQGAVLLVCNRALGAVGRALRAKDATAYPTQEAAMAEMRRHLIAGAYLMPNGIFAVSAAQDAGCRYMRVLV